MKNRLSLLLAGMVALPVLPVLAGTASGTLPVTSTVAAACNFQVSDYSFGSYDTQTTSPAVSIFNNFSILCTSGVTANVSFKGLNDATAGALRYMTDGLGNKLTYTIGKVGATNVSGSNNAPFDYVYTYTSTSGITPVVSPQYVVIIPAANRDAPAGNYSDKVTVTVSF